MYHRTLDSRVLTKKEGVSGKPCWLHACIDAALVASPSPLALFILPRGAGVSGVWEGILSGDTTPCRMTGVSLTGHVQYKKEL